MERSAKFGAEASPILKSADPTQPLLITAPEESDRWTLFQILQMLAVKDNHKEEGRGSEGETGGRALFNSNCLTGLGNQNPFGDPACPASPQEVLDSVGLSGQIKPHDTARHSCDSCVCVDALIRGFLERRQSVGRRIHV